MTGSSLRLANKEARAASGGEVGDTAAAVLAAFCSGLRWDALDEAVRARTRELLLDLIGVALAGSRQSSSRPAVEVALALGRHGTASLLGTHHGTSAVWAALANGTAAHAV